MSVDRKEWQSSEVWQGRDQGLRDVGRIVGRQLVQLARIHDEVFTDGGECVLGSLGGIS